MERASYGQLISSCQDKVISLDWCVMQRWHFSHIYSRAVRTTLISIQHLKIIYVFKNKKRYSKVFAAFPKCKQPSVWNLIPSKNVCDILPKGISWQTMSTCRLAEMSADAGKAFLRWFRARLTLCPHVSGASRNLTTQKSCALLLLCRREGQSLLLKGLLTVSSQFRSNNSWPAGSHIQPSSSWTTSECIVKLWWCKGSQVWRDPAEEMKTTRAPGGIPDTTIISLAYFPEKRTFKHFICWNTLPLRHLQMQLSYSVKKNPNHKLLYRSLVCLQVLSCFLGLFVPSNLNWLCSRSRLPQSTTPLKSEDGAWKEKHETNATKQRFY